MNGKMEGVTLVADWDPKPGFKLGAKDIEGRQTYLGSLVWRNPRLEIREYNIPTPGDDLTGNMLDWQGRIWVTTAGTGGPARVGVINRAKSTDGAPSVKWLLLNSDEVIRNTFAGCVMRDV